MITPMDGRGFPFLVFWPTAIDRTRLDIVWFAADWGEGEMPGADIWQQRLDRFDLLMDEDYRNLVPIQRSMESAAHGGQVVNYQERRIWHVHAWIDKMIGPERIRRAARARHVGGLARFAMRPSDLRWPDLVWSHFSRPRFDDFDARVGAAAAAGFAGIGLYAQAYERMRDEGRKAADIASAVTDHGLALAEVETVKGWWATQGPLAEECLATEQLASRACGCCGRAVSAGDRPVRVLHRPGSSWIRGTVRSRCGARLEGGYRVVAVHQHRSAADAQRIVEAADRPNGGYCADIWHHVHGANDIEMVRQLPADKIFAVQMNDGPARPLIDDYKADCLASRLPPGDGDFDCVGFVRTLVEMGVTAPISLEVCSHELWAAPVDHAAKVAADGMRQVLAQVS